MKRILGVILFMQITFLMFGQDGGTPFGHGSYNPYYYDYNKRNSLAVGYSHINMNVGSFNVGFAEITHYTDPYVGWEYSARIEYGKDFFSYEPAALIGVPMVFFTVGLSHFIGCYSFPLTRLFFKCLSLTSSKVPITVDRYGILEITPYWSLLKITKLYDGFNHQGGFAPNGDVGIQIKVFPFVKKRDWTSQLYMSGSVQFDWGYSNDPRDYGLDEDYYKDNTHSPFYGYAIGIHLGYYMF